MAKTKIRASEQVNNDVTGSHGGYIVQTDGTGSFIADLDFNSNKLTNVTTPTSDNDVSNKGYVDGVFFDYSDAMIKRFLVEMPSEATDGSTVTFTLPHTPVDNTVKVFLNGVLQRSGASYDYTISGASVTFNVAPDDGDVVVASYFRTLDSGEEEETTVAYWFQSATAPSDTPKYQALSSPTMPSTARRGEFGSSVAVYGDYLAAGEPKNNISKTNGGAIRIFKKATYDSGSFSPADLPSLHTWLDASDTDTLTLVDGKVSQWDDKSGAWSAAEGNYAYMSTADLRPTATGVTLNGVNLINFDGTQALDLFKVTYESAFWSQSSNREYKQNGPITVFAVVSNVQNSSGEVAHILGAEHSSIAYHGQYGDHLYIKADNFGGATTYVVPAYDSIFNYSGVSISGSSDSTANYSEADNSSAMILSAVVGNQETEVYSNGVKVASDYTSNAFSCSSWYYASLGGGRNPRNAVANGLSGSIAEVIVYVGLLPDFQRKKVEQYLENKWGTSLLPANHDSGTDLGYKLLTTITGSSAAGYNYLGAKNLDYGTSATGRTFQSFSRNMFMTDTECFVGYSYAAYQTGEIWVLGKDEGGTDNWGLKSVITASDATSSTLFGNALAVSDDRMIVGSYQSNASGTDNGQAYILERNEGGADNWGEVKILTPPSDAPLAQTVDDEFGVSVAISGSYAMVGRIDGGPSNEGRAYIYAKDEGGTDNWGLLHTFTSSQANTYDSLGCAVAISNDIAAVGIAREDLYSGVTDAGAVYLYAKDQGGTDNWGFIKALTAPTPTTRDFYGSSVVLKENILIVSMPQHSLGTSTSYDNDQGVVFVYHKNQGGTDNWGLVQTISGSGLPYGHEDDYNLISKFGSDLDFHRDTVVSAAGFAQYGNGLVQISTITGSA